MRVIAGAARGILLKTPEGLRTRPTAERVKEGLFSAIQFEIPGARCWICLRELVSWALKL